MPVQGVVITAGWATRVPGFSDALAGAPLSARAAKMVTPAAGSPAANRRVKLMRSIRFCC